MLDLFTGKVLKYETPVQLQRIKRNPCPSLECYRCARIYITTKFSKRRNLWERTTFKGRRECRGYAAPTEDSFETGFLRQTIAILCG